MLYVQTEPYCKKKFLGQKHLEFTALETPKSIGLTMINTSEINPPGWFLASDCKNLICYPGNNSAHITDVTNCALFICILPQCIPNIFFFKMHLLTEGTAFFLKIKRNHVPGNKIVRILCALILCST